MLQWNRNSCSWRVPDQTDNHVSIVYISSANLIEQKFNIVVFRLIKRKTFHRTDTEIKQTKTFQLKENGKKGFPTQGN